MSLIKWLASQYLPPQALFLVKKLYYTYAIRKFWEPDIEPIKRLLSPGDVAIDLGANVGWYTHVLAAMVGSQGRVYSIEPIPDTFKLLQAVAAARGLQNVELLNVAVSDHDGSAVMEIPLHEYGGNNFYMAKIVSTSSSPDVPHRRYTVAVRSIDSLFKTSVRPVNFIKCDVEGHELDVLKGTEKVLNAHRPAILLEVAGHLDKEGTAANEVFRMLTNYGYKPYIYDGTYLRPRQSGHWSVNYFFLQPRHLDRLTGIVA